MKMKMKDQNRIKPSNNFSRHGDINEYQVENEYHHNDEENVLQIPRIPPIPKSTSINETHIGIGDANLTTTVCTRCKNEFNQFITKRLFKLCHHCRELQRERSRRWQMKTKEKQGVCRRCGSNLLNSENDYVLCEHCRLNLRSKKAIRVQQGKCVHCSGPKDPEDYNHKVCSRCRENDKIRRANLERVGACNRCTNILNEVEQGHKACITCRNRKRKIYILPNSTNINMGINIDMDLNMNNINNMNHINNFNGIKNGFTNHHIHQQQQQQHDPINGLNDISISMPQIHPSYKKEEIANNGNDNSEFINTGDLNNDKINIKSKSKSKIKTKTKNKIKKKRKLISVNKLDLSIDSNEYNDNIYVSTNINNKEQDEQEEIEISNESNNIDHHNIEHHHHGLIPQIQHSQLNQQLNHHLQLSGVVDETSVDEEAVDRILREANITGISISDDDDDDADEEDDEQMESKKRGTRDDGDHGDRIDNEQDEDQDEDVDEDDMGDSINILQTGKFCNRCNNSISINEISINPLINICSKCINNEF